MKITLLNYEGPVLWAKSSDSGIAIYDQWNELVEVLTREEFCSFIDGEMKLMDSREEHGFTPNKAKKHDKSSPNFLNF